MFECSEMINIFGLIFETCLKLNYHIDLLFKKLNFASFKMRVLKTSTSLEIKLPIYLFFYLRSMYRVTWSIKKSKLTFFYRLLFGDPLSLIKVDFGMMSVYLSIICRMWYDNRKTWTDYIQILHIGIFWKKTQFVMEILIWDTFQYKWNCHSLFV